MKLSDTSAISVLVKQATIGKQESKSYYLNQIYNIVSSECDAKSKSAQFVPSEGISLLSAFLHQIWEGNIQVQQNSQIF